MYFFYFLFYYIIFFVFYLSGKYINWVDWHTRASKCTNICLYVGESVYTWICACVSVYLQCKSAHLFVCRFTSHALVHISYSQFGTAADFLVVVVIFVAVIFSLNFFHFFCPFSLFLLEAKNIIDFHEMRIPNIRVLA